MAGDWAWVADGIAVTTSRRDATNTTLVLGGPAADGRRALLVDPAWEPDELAWIAGDLARRGVEVEVGFATHAHHDHVLWHPGLGRRPRLASPATEALAAAGRGELVSALGPGWPADLAALVGRLHGVAGDRVPWGGRTVELLVHDAHCAGHTALWIPDSGVLLAGDMLSDRELPLLESSTLDDLSRGHAGARQRCAGGAGAGARARLRRGEHGRDRPAPHGRPALPAGAGGRARPGGPAHREPGDERGAPGEPARRGTGA